jgi:hypothetical protein
MAMEKSGRAERESGIAEEGRDPSKQQGRSGIFTCSSKYIFRGFRSVRRPVSEWSGDCSFVFK